MTPRSALWTRLTSWRSQIAHAFFVDASASSSHTRMLFKWLTRRKFEECWRRAALGTPATRIPQSPGFARSAGTAAHKAARHRQSSMWQPSGRGHFLRSICTHRWWSNPSLGFSNFLDLFDVCSRSWLLITHLKALHTEFALHRQPKRTHGSLYTLIFATFFLRNSEKFLD